MKRFLFPIYGILSYLVFFLTFLYAIGFIGNFLVPRSIDSGIATSTGAAVLINLVLISLFAVQHSVMARPWFKQWWTQYVPEPIERSTYVLLSSLLLILIFACWQPLPMMIWSVEQPFFNAVLWGVFAAGWLIVLISTFLINHFDLFGLRQVYLYMMNKPYNHIGFKTVFLYKLVRHPIMLGFIIAFWATPHMSVGHLLFAVVTTVYIIVAIQFEEHDLRRHLGDTYDEYRQQVSMLVPSINRRKD